MNHLALVTSTLLLAIVAVAGTALGTDDRPGDTEKKPGAVERLKQKVLGDRPERESDPVKAAQRALRDRGYDPGPVDGNHGPKTRAAIKDFQAAEGLKVTGRLDADTLGRLRARRTNERAERTDRDAGTSSALPRQDRETNRPGPGASSQSPQGELAKDAAKTRK
jgi:peptidoglycan hydrolase-like protein with peptidoglycan-binding domain